MSNKLIKSLTTKVRGISMRRQRHGRLRRVLVVRRNGLSQRIRAVLQRISVMKWSKRTSGCATSYLAAWTVFAIVFADDAGAQYDYCNRVGRTFCVSGDSTGIGWSWAIVINGHKVCSSIVEPLPPGRPCKHLVAAFKSSIEQNCGMSSGCTVESTDDNCCFRVVCKEDFQFFVGDQDGDPESGCEVTNNPAGCSFNPLIMETADDGNYECPAASEWGLFVLGLVTLASGTVAVRRRFSIQ